MAKTKSDVMHKKATAKTTTKAKAKPKTVPKTKPKAGRSKKGVSDEKPT